MQDASAYADKVRGHPAKAALGATWVHQMLGVASHAQLDVGTNPDPATNIPAYVNHARWVVDCPDCRNAQLACKTDPRFLCDNCGNVAVGKLWRTVVWPANVVGIENMLQGRPFENQNWNPGDTGPQLGIENLTNMGKIA